ncbi:MAG: TIM44-like domain-containing protein [Desulfovibrio sp.]
MTKRAFFIFFVALISATLMSADLSFAKRMGGGKSFGRSSSFSKSSTQSKSVNQSKSTSQQKKGGFFNRPGMGLLGGLLAGTMLGSLLGGGGFMGPGLFEMLIIGGLIYLAFRFFSSRKKGGTGQQATPYRDAKYESNPGQQKPQADRFQQAEQAWQRFDSKPQQAPSSSSSSSSTGGFGVSADDMQGPEINLPAGFDAEDFVKGAKAIYTRLQAEWDKRDLSDISQFCTPEVVSNIEQQMKEDPQPSTTEILLVNARLLEVKQEGAATVATVYYDVMMREDANSSQPEQVREVWHFERYSEAEMWKLAGIQQLED